VKHLVEKWTPISYNVMKLLRKYLKGSCINVTRQLGKAQERKRQKEQKNLIKQLELSDFAYVANDNNMISSAMGPQLVDFMKVLGLPKF